MKLVRASNAETLARVSAQQGVGTFHEKCINATFYKNLREMCNTFYRNYNRYNKRGPSEPQTAFYY